MRNSTAPGRIKRTVRATLGLSCVMPILGLLLWADVGTSWTIVLGYSFWDVVHILHVVNALAILAQAAAAASSFDMWEEREGEQGSPAGTIPRPLRP